MNIVDDAVLALLNDIEGLNVHDGDVPDSNPSSKVISAELPYVVLYSTPGAPATPRLRGITSLRIVEFQISGVGEDRWQAKWALEQAEAALHGALVEIGGRKRRIVRTDDNLYVRRDDTWTRPGGLALFYGADRYRIKAR